MFKEIPNINNFKTFERGIVLAVYHAFEMMRAAFFVVKIIFQLMF